MHEMQTCDIILTLIDRQIVAHCSWIPIGEGRQPDNEFWQGVDVFFKLDVAGRDSEALTAGPTPTVQVSSPVDAAVHELTAAKLGSSAALTFIIDSLKSAAATVSPSSGRRALKFVLPLGGGYIIRSDLLTTRLIDCDFEAGKADFAEPEQFYTPKIQCARGVGGLYEIISGSIGGVLVKDVHDRDLDDSLKLLTADIDNRLSFPWLTSRTTGRKRIALFEGRMVQIDTDMIYAAAKAMNFDIVVLDRPGHWCQDEKWSHLREAFIPINIWPDEGLPGRIVDALRAYGKPFDGIFTFADVFTEALARVSKVMGFPHNSAEGFRICSDKYNMRRFLDMPCVRASKVEDLEAVHKDTRFRYPLIVKPCLGWNSEGVSKIHNPDALEVAMTAFNTAHHGHDVVIENYCDGPEVDVNIIIEDGKVMWFEVSDDFPKGGDTEDPNAILPNVFLETGNLMPSGLPADELEMLRDSARDLLLRLGITYGIYHIEVRVQDSKMTFQPDESGIMDLRMRANPPDRAASMFLVELNPRPPGMVALYPIYHTYGIDYAALGMLYAMGDRERAHVLLHPFKSRSQGYYEIVLVPGTKGGVFDTEDSIAELLERRPGLRKFVAHGRTCYQKGDMVPDPKSGTFTWIVVILVRSRTSRQETRERAEEVRREVRFEIRELREGEVANQTH